MRSLASADFWDCYAHLPVEVREAADRAYEIWLKDPFHPSLHFKRIAVETREYWSVRVGRRWRALGAKEEPEEIIWFWIGSHADYDRIIKNL